MTKQSKKLLEFNGRALLFLAIDGMYWVAIKPICQALGINYDRQFKNLKADGILGQLYAEQHMVAADGKLRKMLCLPEKWVYGWLFSIRSESEDLKAFKRECYQVLYDHFHGPLTERLHVLHQKTEAELEVERLTAVLLESDDCRNLQAARQKVKTSGKQLTQLDQDLRVGQLSLWQ